MTKDVRSNLQKGIELAKSKWTEHLANRIHNLANNPKDAWKAVTSLKKWIQGYHKSPYIIRLKNKNSKLYETNEENIESLSKHFEKLFNSKVNIDWELLNQFIQKPVNNNINSPLSWKELSIAINKLTLHKALLNDENKQVLLPICCNYFNDYLNIEERKIGNLKILQKKVIFLI